MNTIIWIAIAFAGIGVALVSVAVIEKAVRELRKKFGAGPSKGG